MIIIFVLIHINFKGEYDFIIEPDGVKIEGPIEIEIEGPNGRPINIEIIGESGYSKVLLISQNTNC